MGHPADGSEMPRPRKKETIMKIVVIGGTGLIGSRLVNQLRARGHEAVAAAPNTGVNTVTGEGLTEALKGASAVVDVSNSPSWEDAAVLKFFETSTRAEVPQDRVSVAGQERVPRVLGARPLADE